VAIWLSYVEGKKYLKQFAEVLTMQGILPFPGK
jgi:hypothetical protein